jgi:hypothetical protein
MDFCALYVFHVECEVDCEEGRLEVTRAGREVSKDKPAWCTYCHSSLQGVTCRERLKGHSLGIALGPLLG